MVPENAVNVQFQLFNSRLLITYNYWQHEIVRVTITLISMRIHHLLTINLPLYYAGCLSQESNLRKPIFSDATTGFSPKYSLRNQRRNSILMTRHYPDLSSAFDWSYRKEDLLQPIRSKSGQYFIISMEFLSSFLKRHFAWKPMAASQNVGCFLRLT